MDSASSSRYNKARGLFTVIVYWGVSIVWLYFLHSHSSPLYICVPRWFILLYMLLGIHIFSPRQGLCTLSLYVSVSLYMHPFLHGSIRILCYLSYACAYYYPLLYLSSPMGDSGTILAHPSPYLVCIIFSHHCYRSHVYLFSACLLLFLFMSPICHAPLFYVRTSPSRGFPHSFSFITPPCYAHVCVSIYIYIDICISRYMY